MKQPHSTFWKRADNFMYKKSTAMCGKLFQTVPMKASNGINFKANKMHAFQMHKHIMQ